MVSKDKITKLDFFAFLAILGTLCAGMKQDYLLGIKLLWTTFMHNVYAKGNILPQGNHDRLVINKFRNNVVLYFEIRFHVFLV